MNHVKYCVWYFDDWLDTDKRGSVNKWICISKCGDRREVSRNSKFYRAMYSKGLCPKCNKPMTVGELM